MVFLDLPAYDSVTTPTGLSNLIPVHAFFILGGGSSQLDAKEIVTLLCNTGMYDAALLVCATYDLKLHSLFESITYRSAVL